MSERWRNKAGHWGWMFVPAPGWPRPPEGWVPPPGWRPAPGWPTPEGWRWMRRTPTRILFEAVRAVVFVVLILLELIARATGHSLDPTDPSNFHGLLAPLRLAVRR